ncbi:GNAT family N-acetyltransferase [Rufibacter sp. LB8]|uniref:GNAT family N-acetyltransferase n=1 Tax=Rufibacter sp. LB8 TaxID=2777781 RepID=UPI00178C61A8|nr:GNAT family N-acetyltransferase [Rufibacter sp. LB8]
MQVRIRPIAPQDNAPLAEVIKTVFREFKIDKPGTVYTDPTTCALFELFQTPHSAYLVAEENGKLLGGCGIYPTPGLPAGCAELVKFYLRPEARGKGLGSQLVTESLQMAKIMGYRQLYLESFPELGQAVGMYEKAGFKFLDEPRGNSGHFACTIWMLVDL